MTPFVVISAVVGFSSVTVVYVVCMFSAVVFGVEVCCAVVMLVVFVVGIVVVLLVTVGDGEVKFAFNAMVVFSPSVNAKVVFP